MYPIASRVVIVSPKGSGLYMIWVWTVWATDPIASSVVLRVALSGLANRSRLNG